MATATDKRKVSTSQTVGLKTATMAELKEAQTFLGAPDSATVNVANVGPSYVDGQVDENSLPFQVTFSWTEDK